MNEFEWEQQLRESDQLTDKYLRLIDQYGDGPEAQQQIAREMGWNLRPEPAGGEPTPNSPECVEEPADHLAYDAFAEPLPDPRTEGIDWLRDGDGEVRHPLSLCAQLFAMALWQHCDAARFDPQHGDGDLHELLFQSQVLSAKLAGSLDAFATRPAHSDPGLIVACLKRALLPLNRSLAALERVAAKELLPPERLANSRRILFDIREKMLELMHRYRQQDG